MEATKRPWAMTHRASHIYRVGNQGPEGVICKMSHEGPLQWAAEPASLENTANAELIVRAVNSHDALVEALKVVVNWHRENDSGEGELFGRDYITTCIAALNRAEGEV